MFSPITLNRILRLNKKTQIRSFNDDTFLHNMLNYINRPNAANIPLGRWCHPSAEKYKNTCKPDIKADLANSDNSHQDNYNYTNKSAISHEKKNN